MQGDFPAPPALSAELDREIRKAYEELDAEIAAYSRAVSLACIPGCGRCCHTPCENVEASLLEMVPLAKHLFETSRADVLLNQEELLTPDAPCIFYDPQGFPSLKGCCTIYSLRPLTCRLFGFSALTDKREKKRAVICAFLKAQQPRLAARIKAAISRGVPVPDMAAWERRLSLMDPNLGMRKYPVNIALKQVLEWHGLRTVMSAKSFATSSEPGGNGGGRGKIRGLAAV